MKDWGVGKRGLGELGEGGLIKKHPEGEDDGWGREATLSESLVVRKKC